MNGVDESSKATEPFVPGVSVTSNGATNDKLAMEKLPAPVARIWDRLEVRDHAMIVCLESIVRSVRIDGTASVEEIASHFVERQMAELRASSNDGSSTRLAVGPDAIREDLHTSVLPRLAAADLITIPADGLSHRNAVIAIANPLLRLALLESGLIRLGDETSMALSERAVGQLHTQESHADHASAEWAQVWFAMQRAAWTSVAVVPSTPGMSGLAAARALVAAGREYQEGSVHLVDATGAAPQAVDIIIASISGAVASGTQLIIALDCPTDNPAAIPIARHVGVVLLVVPIGVAQLQESRRAIDSIGRNFFIGSVAVHPARA